MQLKCDDNVIETVDLNYFRYKDINWVLKRGHIHSIIGGSGVGKSSFLRVFLGLSDYTGKIFDQNEKIWNVQNQNIAVQFQNSALLSHLTVGANIYLPLCMKYDISIDIAEMIAVGFMEKVSLSLDDFNKLPCECSGGMQKRASLARALILSPEILFLDEPTSGLDSKSAFAYDVLIKELKNSLNMTVLMVSHDLERVEEISDMVTIITKEGFFTDTFSNLKNSDNLVVRNFFRYNG
ncbi:ABC transporter ATP-binding protein [Alphaproteobacteria bacterium endosymbiont of Tiliacea citrago]|uniref:ABC transporter ATP-binding protein n=1 Tax=Alphaproteobacteria bacterium endosymbiont of Tiliacea citrago TaxID=3077944 RepID=UPI00313EC905